MSTATVIKGRKGGKPKTRTPVEQPDDLQSVAKAKILLALGEGEFAGGLTAKDIYLDGTPLENADGSQNFSGVAWEFRPGTQAQNYIQGIPGSENEISVGTEIKSATAWTHTFTNAQMSAIRLRLKWPSLFTQEDDGDLVGNTVKYAIDLQTDGGSWQTVVDTAVTGKTTSGYERSHRIELPQAASTWTVRLRKITVDANSAKVGDKMTLESYTEVIDAKLRYPNTALLYIEFDSSQFNGSIPQIACEPRMRVIRVPDTYNPETREYSGVWTGAFKWAWTDNPAWIFYDLVVSGRFGLGNRLTAENISKWTLYEVAQYCDQLVPDGKGGDGVEPRYTCNVYVQDRNDAYTVLRDFAAIFRGMVYWGGDQIVALADMPRDVDYTYTRANVIDGKFTYSSSSAKTRYTTALVSWSDPANAYSDAMEPVFEQPLVARYGFNQLEMTAIGCTRQSEANRKGRWGILTNNKDRVVTFGVGLDGNNPQPGYIIAVADEMLAGRSNGGRISAVSGRVITFDRNVDAKPGARLQVNLPSGTSQSRTIQSVNGARQVTITTPFSEAPQTESVWAIEWDELYLQQYRVVSVSDNSDGTFTVSGAAHDPDKFSRIDTGAIIDERPVSVVPPGHQAAPEGVSITSYSVVNQGISVETMQASWAAVKNAISYEAQWRRNDGNWVNVPRSSTTSFDVSGIYAGRYLVRVRAINAAEVSSGWAYSEEKTLTGKIGEPLAPVGLATTSLTAGIEISWGFPANSGDTQRTEVQYSPDGLGNGALPLTDVAYPGNRYQQMGLQFAQQFWYRARLVDRLGNKSPWTGWVYGMASDNMDDYYKNLDDAIRDTDTWGELNKGIQDNADVSQSISDAVDAARSIADEAARGVAQQAEQLAEQAGSITKNTNTIVKEIADRKAAVTAEAEKRAKDVAQTAADARDNTSQVAAQAAADLLAARNEVEAQISSSNTTMQDGFDSLAQQIASISAGTGEQFDSLKIWYYDSGPEGWAQDDANNTLLSVTDDGWILPAGSTSTMRSPNPLAINGDSYKYLRLRMKRVGSPTWSGYVYWIGAGEQGWQDSRRLAIPEPAFDPDTGISVISIADIPWQASDVIRRLRFDFSKNQNASNYFAIDWLAVGRPSPGASQAQIQDLRSAMTAADSAEAASRNLLAVQLRGSSTSADPNLLTSGLIFNERKVRITAEKAIASDVTALQTDFNANKSEVSQRLDTLTDEQTSQAGTLTQISTSLGNTQQELGKVRNDVAQKADASALQQLQNVVTQNGKTLSSQGQAITSLQGELNAAVSTLNGKINTKADSSALQSLTQRVTATENSITSQSDQLTTLGASQISGSEIYNGTFSTSTAGWVNSGNGSGFKWSSEKALISTTASIRTANVTPIPVEPGEKITLSLEMRGTDGYTGGGQDTMGFISDLGNPVGWIDGMNATGFMQRLTTDWSSFNQEFTIPVAYTAKYIYFRIGVGSVAPSSARVMIRNVIVTKRTGVATKADASVMQALQAQVTQQGDNISSQGSALTQLRNDLETVNADVGTKASADSVQQLSQEVTKQGDTLTSQGQALTQLQGSFDGLSVGGANLLLNTDRSAAPVAKKSPASRYEQWGLTAIKDLRSLTLSQDTDFTYSLWFTELEPNFGTTKPFTSVALGKRPGGDNWSLRLFAYSGVITQESATVYRWTGTMRAPAYSVMALTNSAVTMIFEDTTQQTGCNIVRIQLERGNRGTDWSPAADDVQSQLTATSDALSGLTQRVSNDEGDIAAQAALITKLRGDLSATNSDVATKASSSALQSLEQKVSQQGSTITSQSSSLTALENSLAQTQNDLDASGQVIGNMLQNASFERGFTGWGNTTWQIFNAQNPHSGKVILRAGKVTSSACVLDQSVFMQAGRTYEFGGFLRRESVMEIRDPGNTKISLRNDSGPVKDISLTMNNLTTGPVWSRISTEYTPANDVTLTLSFRASLNSGYIYLDDAFVVDVTDIKKTEAQGAAITGLTNRVSSAEGRLESQSASMTSLNNTLTSISNDAGSRAATPGNMLRNASFEINTQEWEASGPFSIIEAVNPRSGSKILKATSGTAALKQRLSVTSGRTYRYGIYYRRNGSAVVDNEAYNKLRIGTESDAFLQELRIRPDMSSVSSWAYLSADWSPAQDMVITLSVMSSLSAGEQYFDDVFLIDVTAEALSSANAGAIFSLTNRVSNAEGAISSQGKSITSLTNSLSTKASQTDLNGLTTKVNAKADSSALQALQSQVTQQGGTLTSQGDAIRQLNNMLILGNQIVNGDLSSGADSWRDSGTGSSFTYNSGEKALQTGSDSIRVANVTAIPVEAGMQMMVSFEMRSTVAVTATSSDSVGFVSSPGFNPQEWIARQEGWMSGIKTGYQAKQIKLVIPDSYSGQFVYLRFASASATPSTARILIRNIVVTSSIGIASSLQGLTTRVTNAEGIISSTTTEVSKLTSRVNDAESSLSGLNETVAQNGLAMANGFNQMRSMIGDNSASITQTNKTVTDLEKSTAEQVNTLNSKYGDMSATVQQTASTVADINGRLGAQWGVKVATGNGGTPVVAGIQLGINGSGQSQFLVSANNFGIYTPGAAGNQVMAFAVEGATAYLRSAMIKEASIDFAKISDTIQSTNYVPGQQGWRIAKGGGSEFHNVLVRGEVHADSGVFNGTINAIDGKFTGTVEARNFIGDISNSGRFPDFTFDNRDNGVSRIVHHDSGDSSQAKTYTVNGLLFKWNGGGTVEIGIWINNIEVTHMKIRIETNVENSSSRYMPFQATLSGVYDRDVPCEIRVDERCQIISACATMTRGSGGWSS
ncbi:DUF1983 domain-containing protein [Pluralibacter gergoviae]|nr:DUF1983 domain-containing protein [Pluralibacter gergoviae]ELW9440228.1 DUF1983 domain-containing protein [Pluralibacter gergoviae]